jgi:natural product biosynthesis luciferase-like monooxygenase protein/amino acid adenylation domain-containing protein
MSILELEEVTAKRSQLSAVKRALLEKQLQGKASRTPDSHSIRRRASNEPAPLSFAQQRLFFVQQWEGNSPVYNIPAAVRLTGVLNPETLRQTFNEIIRRHEILRTIFSEGENGPTQIIVPAVTYTWPCIDLRSLPVTTRETEIRNWALRESLCSFALTEGPLLRISLWQLDTDEHVLLVTMHHIVSDEWSTRIMIKEVSALYDAFSKGTPAPLPELPIQYADFAQWQREWLQGDVLEQQLDYWREQLKRSPSALDLPSDHQRPPFQTHRGARRYLMLSETLSDALKVTSQRESVTLFMILVAAFKTLLYRVTGQDDIAIGSSIANRNRAETESLIGLFVNMLVLRTRLDGNPSFRELLARTREVVLGAIAHQDIPFERLVEELQPERDLTRTPFFQVVLVLDNTGRKAPLTGLNMRPLDVDNQTAKFDLTLYFSESEQGLGLTAEYNQDLFETATIDRLMEQFNCVLAAVVDNPDHRISTLPLLSEREEHELLAAWNDSEVFTPGLVLHELFEQQAVWRPDAVAVVFEEQQLTYRELNERSNQLARYLTSLGVGPESRVGLLVERSAELLVGLLGVLKTGGAYVPLDPDYPAQRVNYMLRDAGISLLLTQSHLAGLAAGVSDEVVLVYCDAKEIAQQSRERVAPSAVTGENLAYIIYTSGSTGGPKGVMVTHANATRLFAATNDQFHFGPNDTWTLFHSYAFDFSVWEIWGALLYGGRLFVVPYLVSRSPEEFFELLLREGVTVLNQTPSAFQQLIQVDEKQDTGHLSLRAVIFGGEALNPRSLRSWVERHPLDYPKLINMYGITETTVHVTFREIDRQDIESARSPIGKPMANLRVGILDRYLQMVPGGVLGELFVGGAGVSRGYLNRPDLTAERFIPNAFSSTLGTRLYRTGDLGRYSAGSEIEYLGRADHQVKIRGFRIELGEIEAALKELVSIKQCVVVAEAGDNSEKRLIAYIVPQAQPGPDSSELQHHLKERLPQYMIPAIFVVIYHIPLTTSGKLDRAALPVPEQTPSKTGVNFVAPQTPVEGVLASIWSQVLQLEAVSTKDDFFSLGGDSIRCIQVVSKAQARGFSISIRDIFKYRTIHELAQSVGEFEPGSEIAAVSEPFELISEEDRSQLSPEIVDAYPLAQLQAGMFFHSQWNPNAATYHDVLSLELRCDWDVAVFEEALARLVERHSILRTSFDMAHYSQPLQLVHARVTIPVHVEDLREYQRAEQEQLLGRWIETEQQRDFDLTTAPLLRFFIHRRTDDSFQLIMSFHHAILDGWSVALLLAELFDLYVSLLHEGSLSPVRPVAASYRDFVALEQSTLQSAETKDYWDRKLADYTVLTLPATPGGTTETRPAVEVINMPLPVAQFQELKQLARSANIPLKSVLLAAHLRVMNLISGQSDVLTGFVTHGRTEGNEGEQVLGLFLNTIPFRFQLQGGTWLDLMVQVFQEEQELFPHRRYPVGELHRKLATQTLFEVVFNFTQYHVYDGLRKNTGVELLNRNFLEQTNFPLLVNFSIDPAGKNSTLQFEYDSLRFSSEQINTIAGYYITTLQQIADDPAARYEYQNLLSPQETRRLLVEWNDTLHETNLDHCIHELFEAQVESTPDAVALSVGSQQLTYRELNRRANQLARDLQQRGVGPEVRVALYLERSLEMLIGLLGILKAGGAYVPLDLVYPPERLKFITQDAGASLLLTHENLAQRLPELETEVICLDTHERVIAQQSAENPCSGATSRNVAYIIHTSGSTGQPKGVMVQHRGVINFFNSMDQRIGCDASDALLAVTSTTFDISVLELLWTLTRRAKVMLFSESTLDETSTRTRPRSDKALSFSLFYFANEDSDTVTDKYRLLIEAAKFADQHGFEALWTPERHFHTFGGLYANPAVTSAALATVTEQLKLRAGSVVLPLHDPIRVAEEWSMVDGLSKGRVGLSVASGWHANDFTFFPENYANRRGVTWQNLETVKKLWRGESVTRQSGSGKEIEVGIYPKPIQPELPIWITAGGAPETFIKAGELGANVLTHLLGQTLEDVAEKINLYRRTLAEHGHDPQAGRVTLMLHTFIGHDKEAVREKIRTPFLNYLHSSVDLISNLFKTLNWSIDLKQMSPQDADDLMVYAFNRYFESSALFGTPESCQQMTERLKEIGVDEVACLIDFGVDADSVLAALPALNELKNLAQPRKAGNHGGAGQFIPPDISMMQCTPSLMKLLTLDRGAIDALQSLRVLLLGGEALPLSLAREIKETLPARLVNMYGPTETTIWSTTGELTGVADKVSIGRPIDNTQVYLLDPHFQPAPTYTPGELYIGGDGLARGYIGQPALTAERFVPDSLGTAPGGRLYRTGDLAGYLPDGRIEFLRRNDHQVKLRGIRVEVGEIEVLLTKHEDVRQAVVLAREDIPGDTRLVAYIIPAGPQAPATAVLRRHLQTWLPDYLVPSAFVFLESLPLTVSGKVDRRVLPAPSGDRPEQDTPFVEPSTPTEIELAEIWKQILRVERVGLHDNFFNIGGHSLLAVQLVSRINAKFGVELALRDLFGTPVLEAVAARVDEATLAQSGLTDIDQMLEMLESIDDDKALEMLLQDEAQVESKFV